MLMHVVGPDEQSLPYFAFRADGYHLAAWVHQLVGVILEEVEVQAIPRELGLVEITPARPDRNVARW